MQPLCFAILKSLTPPDVETVLHDERLEEIPFDEPTDLVAMTVETYTARRAYQIASEYRQRGVPVVMGGYHPTFLPEECLRFATAVVEGDAEGVWRQVVDDARRGELMRRYRNEDFPDLAGRPIPDRSVFDGRRYAPIDLVQYGRGCKYACDFCSIRAFYGSSLRQRPLARFVEEIEQLNSRHLFIVDDNIFTDLVKARELFRALIPLRIKWSCQVSIDLARDPELVQLMADSGCLTAVIGFESLDDNNLKQMRKQWNTRYISYADSIRVFQDAGIMIYGSFVFGYDHDTPDSFERTVEFAIRHRLYLGNFNPLTPTPGARLFDTLRREDRLIHGRWWLDPDYRYGQATFRPRGMTAEQLTEGCFEARRMFNTWSSIGRRSLAPRTNLGSPYRAAVYWMSNLISRREIHKKQLSPLGLGGSSGHLLAGTCRRTGNWNSNRYEDYVYQAQHRQDAGQRLHR